MQNVRVAVTGGSDSQRDKAAGREGSAIWTCCGVERATCNFAHIENKMRDSLPSKLAQAASRYGESSCSILEDCLGNNNRRHVPLNFTIITKAACLYYCFPLILSGGFLTLFTMKMSCRQMHQSLKRNIKRYFLTGV